MLRPRKPKPAKVWYFPNALVVQYQKAMRAYVRTLKSQTAAIVIPQVPALITEAYTFRPDDDAANPLFDIAAGTYVPRLRRALDDLLASMNSHNQALIDLARQVGRKTADFNAKQFHLSIRNALSVDLFKSEPWLVGELKAFEAENLRLITSIPAQHVERLQGVIVKGLREGQVTSDLVDAIRGIADITESRAEFIAEDQIGSLNGQLTRLRQQGIGVQQAIWRGVLDRRERPTHRALEGVTFDWKNPPLGGPGAEPRCRCWAAAVFPELKDIDAMVVP